MVTGAIVYDWTYPVLTGEQKQRYVGRLRYWATRLECGYPPPKQQHRRPRYQMISRIEGSRSGLSVSIALRAHRMQAAQ